MNRREFVTTMAAAGMATPFISSAYSNTWATGTDTSRSICIFSKHLQFLPDYKTMAEVALKIGFDGVDLTVRPGGHVLPENVQQDLPKAVEAIKKAGLVCPMMVTKITDPDDPVAEKIVKTASELGIKYYRMGYIKYDKKLSVEESLEKDKIRMSKLADLNKKYNIHGSYQNHSGNRVGGALWDLWLLLKDLDPEWIGCQYDIRHATVEGAYTWPLAMQLLIPYIKTTAIKDFYWKLVDGKWKIFNCPLGEGMVDFKDYFKLYKKTKLSGPITLHVEYEVFKESDSMEVKRKNTTKALKQDLDTLQKMLNKYKID